MTAYALLPWTRPARSLVVYVHRRKEGRKEVNIERKGAKRQRKDYDKKRGER
jgi:hypothetical protein